MKKWFKKTVAVVLTAAMAMTATVPAFAAESIKNTVPTDDLFAQNFSEVVNIEGVDYTYQYSYDENNNETVTITNDADDRVDVVVTDKENSVIYLNNEIAATVDIVDNAEIANNQSTARAGWVQLGDTERYTITIKDAQTVDQVGAIIRGGLSILAGAYSPYFGITVAAVVAKMGTIFLQAYVWAHVDATLNGSFYQMVSFGDVQYRYDWEFVDENGRVSGPHSWFTVMPNVRSLNGIAA